MRIVEQFDFFFPYRYKNLFFQVVAGPAATFVFTLSLTFDYTDRVYPQSECTHRWQMTTSENTVWRKYRGGNNTGKLYMTVQFIVFFNLLIFP